MTVFTLICIVMNIFQYQRDQASVALCLFPSVFYHFKHFQAPGETEHTHTHTHKVSNSRVERGTAERKTGGE